MVTEGVLFHGDMERPLSPYHRVFVITQPAGSGGLVKRPNAAAEALETLIDATDML